MVLRLTNRLWIARRGVSVGSEDRVHDSEERDLWCTGRCAILVGLTPFLGAFSVGPIAGILPNPLDEVANALLVTACFIGFGLWFGRSMRTRIDVLLYGLSAVAPSLVTLIVLQTVVNMSAAALATVALFLGGAILTGASAACSYCFRLVIATWACESCGYDLTRLPTNACPECGATIEER